MNLRRVRELLAGPLLALAACSLTLLACELGFRLAMKGRGGAEDLAGERYLEFDPLLGWRKRPGAEVVFRRSEYVRPVRINSLGQRDRERVYDRPPGGFRILALGDSFLEGYTVDLEETVTQVLEQRLGKKAACPVEVLNAGTAGYSTDQEYLFYREEGLRYEPNLVLLFFYYNDLAPTLEGNYYGKPKPQLVARGASLELRRQTLPQPRAREAAAAPETQEGPRSQLLAWLQERLKRGQPVLYNRLAAAGLWEPLAASGARADLAVYRRRDAPAWVDTAWNQVAAILRALRDSVRAGGAELVIVYVPSPMEVSARARDLTRLAYGMRDEDWDVELVRRRLGDIASRQRMPMLDLTSRLRSVEGAMSGPYLVLDGHWNALGHSTAAEAIEEKLRGDGLLPACAAGR